MEYRSVTLSEGDWAVVAPSGIDHMTVQRARVEAALRGTMDAVRRHEDEAGVAAWSEDARAMAAARIVTDLALGELDALRGGALVADPVADVMAAVERLRPQAGDVGLREFEWFALRPRVERAVRRRLTHPFEDMGPTEPMYRPSEGTGLPAVPQSQFDGWVRAVYEAHAVPAMLRLPTPTTEAFCDWVLDRVDEAMEDGDADLGVTAGWYGEVRDALAEEVLAGLT